LWTSRTCTSATVFGVGPLQGLARPRVEVLKTFRLEELWLIALPQSRLMFRRGSGCLSLAKAAHFRGGHLEIDVRIFGEPSRVVMMTNLN
jgi:hypothetical protein